MEYDVNDSQIGFVCDACNREHDFHGPFYTVPCVPNYVADMQLCDYCYEDYCMQSSALHDNNND